MNISFREVEIDDAKMLLDWRTSPHITKQMITDVPYDLNAQKKWIHDSYNRPDFYHWIILCDTISIGHISVQNFDFDNAQTYWGFYKGVEGFYGVGSKIIESLYNWLFLHVGIKNIFTDVFYNNIKAMDLYLSHGHKFMPSRDRIVYKNGCEMLLVHLLLSENDWDKEKYKDSIAHFPTTRWKYAPI